METSNCGGGIDHRVMRNIRFKARRLAYEQSLPGMEVDDYEQDLVADLLHRRRAFDPRLASFATFADRIVDHRISTMTKPTRRLRAERNIVSLDAPILDEDGNEQTLLELLPNERLPADESAAMKIDVGRFVEGLPQPLLDCCEILLADSISEGARAAGIHRSTAYERAARLRERAAARGLDIYVSNPSDTPRQVPVDGCGRTRPAPGPDIDRQGTNAMSRHGEFTTARLSLSEIDLCGWLGQAQAGEMLEYYRGFLLVDALPQSGRLPEQDRAELGRVARRALWAADRGLARLVQRRHGSDDYSYLLIARARPTPPASLSELFAAELQ